MKVTYISHSGFAVELSSATLLFDYYQGHLPAFSADKPLFVFSSHSHADHFVPQIFGLRHEYSQVHYILSHDIWMMRKKHIRAGVSEESFKAATYMRAHETRYFSLLTGEELPAYERQTTDDTPALMVTTLRSTDMGVAFLIECEGLRIYHAGDLHWWAWPGDTKQAANNMTANYQREISHLRELLTTRTDISPVSSDTTVLPPDTASWPPLLDLAFLPLDGRLEENYALGMEYFLSHIPTRHVFPMHFWDNYKIITDYLQACDAICDEPVSSEEDSRLTIHPIHRAGEVWLL